MSFTLLVPLDSPEALELALAEVEALSPRAIELLDDPPTIAAWIDLPSVALARRHAIEPARLLDHGSTWSPRAGRLEIAGLRVDPGGAFGSGLHPTTALCLERVRELARGRRCLDVGTGTGILALAALSWGATSAHGTDLDPAALAVARDNAAYNGLELSLGVELPDARFTLVLANVLGAELLELAPELVRRLDSGGVLLVSGVRASERAEVLGCYRRWGLHVRAELEREGWWALELGAPW